MNKRIITKKDIDIKDINIYITQIYKDDIYHLSIKKKRKIVNKYVFNNIDRGLSWKLKFKRKLSTRSYSYYKLRSINNNKTISYLTSDNRHIILN